MLGIVGYAYKGTTKFYVSVFIFTTSYKYLYSVALNVTCTVSYIPVGMLPFLLTFIAKCG